MPNMRALPIIESHLSPVGVGTAGAQLVVDRDGEEWIIKPVARRYQGTQATVTEYLASQFVALAGVPVPQHAPVLLPDRLIQAVPDLQHFQDGPVLGVRRVRGLNLQEVQFLAGTGQRFWLDPVHSRRTALATATTDTWLWNADRSPGTYGRHAVASHAENLYLEEPPVPSGNWRLTPIDYDRAFYGAQWGSHSNGDWPVEVLGTMRFYFAHRFLPPTIEGFMAEAAVLIDRIETMDIDATLHRIVDRTPASWLDGTCGDPIEGGHLADLQGRLERQTSQLRATLTAKYAVAVEAWGGV